MADVTLFKQDASEAGKAQLKDSVFKHEVNQDVLHESVLSYLANQRQGTRDERIDQRGRRLLEQGLEQERRHPVRECESQHELDAAASTPHRRERPFPLQHAERPPEQPHEHPPLRFIQFGRLQWKRNRLQRRRS